MFIIAKILAIALSSANKCNTRHFILPVARWGIRLSVFLLVFILGKSALVYAAPVIAVNEQTSRFNLARHVDILENSAHTINIDQILTTRLIHEFAPADLASNDSLASISPIFWLRFSLNNTSDKTQVFWLSANNTAIESLVLYQLPVNNPLQYTIARDAPIQNNDYAPVLKEIVIPAHSSMSYLVDIHAITKNSISMELIKPENFLPEHIQRSRLFSFFLGLLTMMSAISLFVAILRKSMLFMHFSGLLLAYIGIVMVNSGIPKPLFSHFAEWQNAALVSFFYLLTSLLLITTREYVKSCGTYNKHLAYIGYAQLFNTAACVVIVFWDSIYTPILLAPLMLSLPVILSALYSCYKNNNDHWALWIAILILSCAGISNAYLLINTNVFSLAIINDPFIIFVIIIETAVTLAILIARENQLIQDEFNKQQISSSQLLKHRAQNDLMQEVSRDMQTPLSGILGMADLLKSSSLTAEQYGKVDTIKNSGQALLNKISDIYFRIQLEKNVAGIRKSPFELILLMENCMAGFQLPAEINNTELILQIQPDVPAIVKGDEYRLRQIIIQLLENAVKNTKQGEVLVRLSRNANNADLIEFSIEDTGRGISEDKISLLKKSLKNAVADHNKPGIDTVKELLSHLKSALFIQSIEGEGSIFSFSLNLPAVQTSTEKDPLMDGILNNKRLLIVDDNHTSSKVIKQQASQWGMKVAEAHTGNEAVAMFRAKQNLGETFDAVIVDYDMPQVSGIEVAEKISLDADSRPIIIMLAGLSQSPPAAIAKQAGIDVVLNKPASQKLLQLTLCNLFQINKKHDGNVHLHNTLKLRLLVADDNDVIRSVISKMMDSLNVEYKMVSDGKLAFDAVKKERFDVILMDCEMPFMNGFEATEHIHQWQREKHQQLTPVIALTAYTLGEHKTRSIAAGMADYLEKPINMNELEAVLQRYRVQEKNE
jgi:two-component system, sensor histidine kinase RetS